MTFLDFLGLGGVLFHEEQILSGDDKGARCLNPLSVLRIRPHRIY